jgi:hypothetical protein
MRLDQLNSPSLLGSKMFLGKAPRGQLVASTEAYPIFRQGVTNASIARNRHGSDFDGGKVHFVIFEY